ncbi:olfactory receptor 5AR1-like [Ambystoma mexicanum]|uniref:olfactory receptor 5AR1-like n=1 Tax=Ambystoma mexicanum TaxID=8296 RepID=UPI0037E9C2AF
MNWENFTVTEFILSGLKDFQDFRIVFFVLFLNIYLVTVLGNMTTALIICLDQLLHTPMYFFLCNLSLLDACYISVTVPKMLHDLVSGNGAISFPGCFLQVLCLNSSVGVEFFLLTAMAYDRYVAICNPLRYMMVMNHKVCTLLATGSWFCGFFLSLIQAALVWRLPFCRSNIIHRFFCDIPPLLVLACTDTSPNELALLLVGGVVGFTCSLFTIVSYGYILSTILRIPSKVGKRRAFSTCVSHLSGVTIFYGTVFFIYVRPVSSYSQDVDSLISMVYALLTPLLNPVIYCLRNKEVKGALSRTLRGKTYNKGMRPS